jgi:hypothetical protein
MLRLRSPSPDLLFDALLPEEARLLPGELAQLDELLSDPKLLDAFAEHWAKAGAEGHLRVIDRGRPTIPMATYLRLMVLKHRTGFGYETLMQAVADSLHLRRFCQIPLTAPLPDESTVRKLTRRIGPELTDDVEVSGRERRHERATDAAAGALAEYLSLRQALGFKLHNAARLLGQFVGYLEEHGMDTVTTDDALSWVTLLLVDRPGVWQSE